MLLRVEKIDLTIAAGYLPVFVFLLHNLELLTSLGLEQLKQDLRRMMRKRLQRHMAVIERFEHVVENGLCTRW